MVDHTMRQYDTELDQIRTRVLQMGGYVEQQVVLALDGLQDGDEQLIERVIENDRQVNAYEVELDEACTQIIARRQPAANDLRSILSVFRVVTDLERIGDEAKKIAKVARKIHVTGEGLRPSVQTKHLGAMAVQALRKSLDAFARQDIDAAAEILKEDKDLDSEFKVMMRLLVTYMMEDPRTISRGIDMLFAAKAIERIGDHAKNVAENTIFLAHGKDVRHVGLEAVLREVGHDLPK
ncbi:phosphate signaling complex protein PhoU [Uliginosibacterium gangwonense]|uniref:phosphate signaling complex protein PhoU n=1 Tax=Uliginosibacterium gangwonense TaxID=392736 RepID=UPI000374765F|nr:phosphate signaling complex protein PhoU [Uliginosibacterium gangwonense]